jgi:hypothetical protein
MLANISVGHDANINVLEAIKVFSAAWRTLTISAATVVKCFHNCDARLMRK